MSIAKTLIQNELERLKRTLSDRTASISEMKSLEEKPENAKELTKAWHKKATVFKIGIT